MGFFSNRINLSRLFVAFLSVNYSYRPFPYCLAKNLIKCFNAEFVELNLRLFNVEKNLSADGPRIISASAHITDVIFPNLVSNHDRKQFDSPYP